MVSRTLQSMDRGSVNISILILGLNDENEKIELPMQGDKIMTAAVHNGTPMFFSRLNGLVCITAADFETPDFFNG